MPLSRLSTRRRRLEADAQVGSKAARVDCEDCDYEDGVDDDAEIPSDPSKLISPRSLADSLQWCQVRF